MTEDERILNSTPFSSQRAKDYATDASSSAGWDDGGLEFDFPLTFPLSVFIGEPAPSALASFGIIRGGERGNREEDEHSDSTEYQHTSVAVEVGDEEKGADVSSSSGSGACAETMNTIGLVGRLGTAQRKSTDPVSAKIKFVNLMRIQRKQRLQVRQRVRCKV